MFQKWNVSKKHNSLPPDGFFLDLDMKEWNPLEGLVARVLISLENERLNGKSLKL